MSKNDPKALNGPFHKVRKFHQAFDHPCPNAPTPQPQDRALARADWIDEEVQELRDAQDLADQADAYIDIIYFALGGLVECGIEPDAMFNIVNDANMGKLHYDENGKPFVEKREDGKIIKPENWARDFAPEPRLIEEIGRQTVTRPLDEMN